MGLQQAPLLECTVRARLVAELIKSFKHSTSLACFKQMSASARLRKASWISSRRSQRMRRRRNWCSHEIVCSPCAEMKSHCFAVQRVDSCAVAEAVESASRLRFFDRHGDLSVSRVAGVPQGRGESGHATRNEHANATPPRDKSASATRRAATCSRSTPCLSSIRVAVASGDVSCGLADCCRFLVWPLPVISLDECSRSLFSHARVKPAVAKS
jgi:hypothetical protein